MMFKFVYMNHRHGGETEIEVPGKYEVCHECEGTGTVLMAGLRGVALSSDEMDQDPDFREDYFGGKFDVRCDVCQGRRVVVVPDEARLTKRQLVLWKAQHAANCSHEAELRAERQMRARGIEW